MTAAIACPNPIPRANHSVWAKYNTSNQLTSTSIVANYTYDDAGNTLNDGVNKYVYDLDGRICAVTPVVGGTMTQYVYDAEGRRIAKGTITKWPAAGATCATCAVPTAANGITKTGTGAALYLRGALGDQDTELDGTGVWCHTNVFAGGGLTATYDTGTKATLSFNYSDWLGSKRVQSGFGGAVQNSWASDPFGSTPVQELIHDLVAHNVAITSSLPVFEQLVPGLPLLQKIEDIENVEIVFKDGISYDSAKLIESVRGQVGIR